MPVVREEDHEQGRHRMPFSGRSSERWTACSSSFGQVQKQILPEHYEAVSASSKWA
ncbi:hypothetical protein ABZ424_08510 [Streptomyces sp. NPDC005790]|uniref:hypothetical protein n=1 Tax=Streptomyces sp. NPDC005790 TaxID=3154777 RepID=UPI0033DF185A